MERKKKKRPFSGRMSHISHLGVGEVAVVRGRSAGVLSSAYLLLPHHQGIPITLLHHGPQMPECAGL